MPIDIKIVYCRPCNFLGRALDLARDILAKYEEARVTLEQGTRGIFDVYINGTLKFSRYQLGRFPTSEEVLEEINKLIKAV
ncbi:MAG: Rdx family protein [Sulfolobaceae archaeon]